MGEKEKVKVWEAPEIRTSHLIYGPTKPQLSFHQSIRQTNKQTI